MKFMKDYSGKRNKASTQENYQSVIDHNIIPALGRKKITMSNAPTLRE